VVRGRGAVVWRRHAAAQDAGLGRGAEHADRRGPRDAAGGGARSSSAGRGRGSSRDERRGHGRPPAGGRGLRQRAQAEAFFLKAIEADPQAYQSFYSLGVVQERLGKAAAAGSYRKAFTVVPDYEEAIVAYGLLLAKQENLSEADAFLTDKRGRLPKSAAVAGALAEVKSIAKDTASAQRIAQEALKIEPDYRPAMVTIARDHYRNRRLDLALTALKAILDGFDKTNPARDADNAEAHLLRGLIYAEQTQRVEAMEEFQTAMKLRPDLITARLRVATFLLEVGRAQEALPILQGAVGYEAENVAAHLSLGDAQRLLGRYAEAKREFDWVLSRNASLPQVHYNLALMYLFAPSMPGMSPLGQVDAAIEELNKYQELKPKGGGQDDTDELLQRAKLKKSEIEALAKASQPQPAVLPDAGAGTTAPDGGGAGAADAGASEAAKGEGSTEG
jgi:tetratricopeptide (TPR) repeat protein